MTDRLTKLTAEIVASYVETNKVPTTEVGALVRSTYAALNALGQPAVGVLEVHRKPTPTQIRKSITPDALISFIDGRPYRMLKRHVKTAGFSPEGYRERYGLPRDYPLTAPSYSASRSALALARGLGRKPEAEMIPSPQTATPAAEAAKAVNTIGEKAGPGARVPKAVRRPRNIKPTANEAS